MYFDERENYLDEINYNSIDLTKKDYDYEQNNIISFKEKQDNNYYDANKIIINNYRNENIYKLNEGFNKGNMFPNIYKPYKDYEYKVVVTRKKDEMLLKIQELCFALKDLNLYLDIHPHDKNMLSMFNEYNKELHTLKEEYSKTYGPLCLNEANRTDEFAWVKNPWPWENFGGNK